MNRYVCTVCGYVHTGDSAPGQCPVCKAPASKFKPVAEVERDHKYAGTQTGRNLMDAFSGESQARNKYCFFAEAARNEGYEQIAALFEQTAMQERQHAKMWYAEFHGIGSTAENLVTAAEGEHMEWAGMYARMAREAREEGFHALAERFARVADVEQGHEERYLRLLENIRKTAFFPRKAKKRSGCAVSAVTCTLARRRLSAVLPAGMRNPSLSGKPKTTDAAALYPSIIPQPMRLPASPAGWDVKSSLWLWRMTVRCRISRTVKRSV